MKKRTYNNVIKASRLIIKKGYSKQESLEMALNIFEQLEIAQVVYGDYELTAERLILPILDKADYIAEYGI